MPVWICILVFLVAFGAGVVSKFAIKPAWTRKYAVKWSDGIGTLMSDLPYGDGEANRFDLYLPKDDSRDAAEWVENNPIPTVVAYGACDRVQPFLASKRLESALKESGADYQYFVLEHSGHGLQNDSAVSKRWMEAVEEYLDRYMPVKN